MRSLLLIFAVLLSNTAYCQKDSTSEERTKRQYGRIWTVPIGIAVTATVDGEIREWELHNDSGARDHLAHAVNPLGTAHVLVPAMAIFYEGSLLAHQPFAVSA